MSEMDKQSIKQQMQDSDDAITVLDYLEVIVKRSRMIFRTTAAAAVLSLIISFILPKIYSSTALVLPPKQDMGFMGMMMGQMGGGMSGMMSDILGNETPADQYAGILNSRVIKDAIIDRFKLMEVYDQKYRLDTYKKLEKTVNISIGKKDGIISITVEDKDPQRAADMANAYVEELGKLTIGINIAGAAQNKPYLEERLAKAKVDLIRAEDALKVFQSKNKAVSVPDQAKASIEGVALLKAQLAVQEAQLSALQSQFTDSTQEVQSSRATILNLRSQIASLEGTAKGGAIPSVGSVPDLGQEYLRLMREFKIQEALVELLTKQYEMNKLIEAKDVSTVQVIQKARVPDKKTKPKKSIIILAATFAGFLFAIFYCFIQEYFERLPRKDQDRWRTMMASYRIRHKN